MIANRHPIKREITKISWRIMVGLIFAYLLAANESWLFAVVLGLFFGLLAYTIHNLMQLSRIFRWVRKPAERDMPESTGMWGYVLDRLYSRHQASDQAYQQLLTMLDKARQSTDAWNDAIILLNGSGEIEWMNRTVKRLLGLRSLKDRGELLTNLVRDPRLAEYLQRKLFDVALEIPAPGNPAKIIQFRVTMFGDNESLILVRDVTRIHNLEQMRRDFVANVSHELKTPLTVLMGFLETMSGCESDIPSQWQRPVALMSDQADRMKALVDDLLLLSRLEDDLPSQPDQRVDLGSVLASLCDEARCLSGEHHIELHRPEPVVILGREKELRSAFSNLIINAVKYTNPQSALIKVSVELLNNEVVVSVQDNGAGIESSLIPRLTERFYRVDASRNRSTGGTGLGLAIVKHVMIRHQGRLLIESTLGEGSVFRCHFPDSRRVS